MLIDNLKPLVRKSTRLKEFKPAPATTAKNCPAKILGYWPKRRGFEFECDYDAE